MVKLRAVVLGLCAIASKVLALNEAMPYEMLYFYNVYKMEFAAVPAADRRIATTCGFLPLQWKIK